MTQQQRMTGLSLRPWGQQQQQRTSTFLQLQHT
jgi:hypothetical protein